MDLLGLNMPPAILLGADEVIEQDARARKLKLSRSQLGTWTKDSFGSNSAAEYDARRRRDLPRYRTPMGTKPDCESRRFDQHSLAQHDARQPPAPAVVSVLHAKNDVD